MRGTRLGSGGEWCQHRFIPAHAGNTYFLKIGDTRWTVHPRSCGEHWLRFESSHFLTGSSPLMRGTHKLLSTRLPIIRFIPAHAGNTPERTSAYYPRPVHPRSCGEHIVKCPTSRRSFGSSPLMRGTQLWSQSIHHYRRFIPAHAGNTTSPISHAL